MKKITKVFMVLLATLMLVATQVFAEGEDPQDYGSNPTGEKQIQLYAEVGDTYTVQLPKKVNVATSGQTFTVKAKGDIAADKKITVTLPETANLADTAASGKEAVELTIENNALEFLDSELNSADYNGTGATETVTVNHGGISAGSWSVNINATIALADIA